MKKSRVFCGNLPREKNKEHVLPRWLIELTGEPNRVASFGIDFTKEPFSVRRFSFDSLTFPACTDCNTRFSVLEAATEQVVRKMLALQPLNTVDLFLLLDWLDKVRVGMWLGFLYLDKNFAGIEPRFHIARRLAETDRMVGIIKLEDSTSRLSFTGTESKYYSARKHLIFAHEPARGVQE